MPTPPPRASGKEGRRELPVKIISSPQDEFEKEEMKKGRLVVKIGSANGMTGWLVMYQNQLITLSAKSSREKIVHLGCMMVPKIH